MSVMDDWIKRRWHMPKVEHHSATKRKEIQSLAEVWTVLESVIQSEVSQKEENKYCILMHIC